MSELTNFAWTGFRDVMSELTNFAWTGFRDFEFQISFTRSLCPGACASEKWAAFNGKLKYGSQNSSMKKKL